MHTQYVTPNDMTIIYVDAKRVGNALFFSKACQLKKTATD